MAIVVTSNWSDFEYQRGVRAHLTYIVTGATSADQALTAQGIPSQNSFWPSDFRLLAQQPVVTMLGNAPTYHIAVDWVRPSGDAQNTSDNPLDAPLIYSWEIGNTVVDIERDAEKNPLVNSIGEPFNPPCQVEIDYEQLTIIRNESTFNPSLSRAYRNKVNSGPFLGADAETVRCLTIRPMGEYPVGALYVPVGYTFRLQAHGFKHSRVDESYRGWYVDPDVGDQIGLFVDNKRVPVTTPVKLDGGGKPLDPAWGIKVTEVGYDPLFRLIPPGATRIKQDVTGTVLLEYNQYEKVDFSALGLS